MKHTLFAISSLVLCATSSFAAPMGGSRFVFVEPVGVVTTTENLSITAGQVDGNLALTVSAGNADDRRFMMIVTKQKADSPNITRVMNLLARALNDMNDHKVDYDFFTTRLALTVDRIVLNQKAPPLDFVVRQ